MNGTLPAPLHWIQHHRWAMLLAAIFALLVISPLGDIYDRYDNLISPLAAIVVVAVAVSAGRRFLTVASFTLLTFIWLVIAIVTDGSGIFAGLSILAPLLFLVIVGAVFLFLVHWMIRAKTVTAETLCAAVCGYLIVGIFWAGIYGLVQTADARAFASPFGTKMDPGDLIYFSFTTLTTTGFGDLVPRNSFARMWSVIEAVVGTFYIAIVIARLVTLYGFAARESSSH